MLRSLLWRSIGVTGVLAGMVLAGCALTTPMSKNPDPYAQEVQPATYNGPKARIAVVQFVDRTGKAKVTNAIGDGMAEMLTTLLFQSNRYLVLDRQTVTQMQEERQRMAAAGGPQKAVVPLNDVEGAELLVAGAVTEFEPEAGGGEGSVGKGVLPSSSFIQNLAGSFKQAHLAIDLRLIDTRTSQLVAATSVAGKATDMGLATGGGSREWAWKGHAKTPIEKAIRAALSEAVQFVITQTPASYYRDPSDGGPTVTSALASPHVGTALTPVGK
jgi:curli biogenesis system outer membrane secretion channel CsgG